MFDAPVPAPDGTRCAVVGDNTIDHYLETGVELVGGNALNVAVQLGRASIPVDYYGSVGDDRQGALIRTGLAINGVNIHGLRIDDGATAVTDIRLTDDGDRIFDREDFGVTTAYFPDDDDIERIARADWVHIGMLPRASELRRILRERGSQAVISQDCSVAPGLEDLDVAFISADGADEQHSRDLARRLRDAGVRVTVVTRGEDGAIVLDNDGWTTQQAMAADVVDTTGAGDSFIAGYIAARLSGAALSSALARGARLAAATCGHTGGWPHAGTPLAPK